jgi:putative flippase GtrA
MLKQVLLTRTDSLWVQLSRYTLVGFVAFVADFGCLVLLTELLHLHYLISAALAFLVGLSVNYLLSIKWVFQKRSLTSRSWELLLFTAIGVVGLGLNEATMWFLTGCVGFYYMASKIGSTALVYLWNFLVRRYVLFS